MIPKLEGIHIALAGSGWAAGVIATMTDTHDLFAKTPLLGFMLLGALGGFAGWALLLETGKLDDDDGFRRNARVLLRRILLGVAIGVATGVWYLDDASATNKGLWMLIAGVISTAPVELSKAGIGVLIEFIRLRAGTRAPATLEPKGQDDASERK